MCTDIHTLILYREKILTDLYVDRQPEVKRLKTCRENQTKVIHTYELFKLSTASAFYYSLIIIFRKWECENICASDNAISFYSVCESYAYLMMCTCSVQRFICFASENCVENVLCNDLCSSTVRSHLLQSMYNFTIKFVTRMHSSIAFRNFSLT